MPALAQIGLYWGDNAFSIVENINGQIANILHIPFETPPAQDTIQEAPDELKFPALLQQTLEFRSVKTQLVNIILPSDDLIFRSFPIPFMDKSDVLNVLEFEVTKYIPIKLEELVYTYHAVPYIEKMQKNLRILFLAIRKTRLEEIVNTVEKSGRILQHIEPAAVSLMHLLKQKNLLAKNKTTAVLEIGNDRSEIIVFENETLHFMRKLNISLNHSDLTMLLGSLQNEVRASLNFYARQNPSSTINALIVLAENKIPGIVETIGKELTMPVSVIPLDAFIPLEEFQTNAHVSAYGSTLRKEKFSPKFFDLSQSAVAMQRSGKDPLAVLKQYSILAGIISACLIVIFLTVFISGKILMKNNMLIQDILKKLGPYANLTVQDLKAQKEKIIDELKSYVAVSPSSQMATILREIPDLLPDGMWLTDFQILPNTQKSASSKSDQLRITLRGKIYSPDPNEQFTILNDFIETLKNNTTINIFYNEVKRESANRATEEGYTVTTFSITCN